MRYTIKKGRHYCGINIRLHCKIDTYEVLSKFCSNCWYDEPKNGKNKLAGFTEGLFNIYRRSLMIAWQPDFNNVGMINIYAYWHYDNKRTYDHNYKLIYLDTIPVEKYFKVTIDIDRESGYAVYKYNNTTIKIFYKSPILRIGRYIFPYHGGKNVAPKDETIVMVQRGNS